MRSSTCSSALAATCCRGTASTRLQLLVVLDQGSSGLATAIQRLETTDGVAGDEKVSAFPAVAGDIVFFSTTTYKSVALCEAGREPVCVHVHRWAGLRHQRERLVEQLRQQRSRGPRTGARATAPFIVDQHLVFGTGNTVEVFGDPQDFNNGVGQAGVRILSWREVR